MRVRTCPACDETSDQKGTCLCKKCEEKLIKARELIRGKCESKKKV